MRLKRKKNGHFCLLPFCLFVFVVFCTVFVSDRVQACLMMLLFCNNFRPGCGSAGISLASASELFEPVDLSKASFDVYQLFDSSIP